MVMTIAGLAMLAAGAWLLDIILAKLMDLL